MFKLAQNYYKIDESKITIIPNGVQNIPDFSREKKIDLSIGLEIVFYNGLVDFRARGLEKLIRIMIRWRDK